YVLRQLLLSILFPYTTLFRSVTALIPAVWLVTEISAVPSGCVVTVGAVVALLPANTLTVCPASTLPNASVTLTRSVFAIAPSARSEEHTSELQSRFELVYRLL